MSRVAVILFILHVDDIHCCKIVEDMVGAIIVVVGGEGSNFDQVRKARLPSFPLLALTIFGRHAPNVTLEMYCKGLDESFLAKRGSSESLPRVKTADVFASYLRKL